MTDFWWDREFIEGFKSQTSAYIPKSRDCVSLYFLDLVKNILHVWYVMSTEKIQRNWTHQHEPRWWSAQWGPRLVLHWGVSQHCSMDREGESVFAHYVLVLTQVFKVSSGNKRLSPEQTYNFSPKHNASCTTRN